MHVAAEAAGDAGGARRAPVTRPRPGHADLAGGAKYGRDDLRDILERASARETAARVAAGAVARQLLAQAGIQLTSHVFALGRSTGCPTAVVSFDARRARCPTTRRCAASIADVEQRDDRRDRSRAARPATRSAARSK